MSEEPLGRRTIRPAATSGWQTAATFGLVGVIGAMAAAAASGEPYLAATVVAPLLVLGAVPVLKRVTATDDRSDVAWIFLVGLELRLIASIPRWLEGVDSTVYVRVGRELAESFRSLDFAVDTGRDIPGTGSIRYLSGLCQAVLFDSAELTTLVFTLLGFVGCVLIYRAGEVALPEVDHRRVAIALALWPTLVYWPSSIGKEAVVLLGIGLVARGAAARLAHAGGIPLIATGAVVTGLVRPHITLLLFGSLLIAYLLAQDTAGRRGSTAARILTIALLMGGLLITSGETLRLVEDTDTDPTELDSAGFVEERTSQGNSAFTPATVEGPLDYPYAVITVLFRPFPWEATSTTALVTALEGTILMAIAAARVGHVLRLPGSFRVRPLIGFSVIYLAGFCYAFSPFGNFGLLARQRAQAVPFLLMLLMIPSTDDTAPASRSAAAPVPPRRRAIERRAAVGWDLVDRAEQSDADRDQQPDRPARRARSDGGPRWRSNVLQPPDR